MPNIQPVQAAAGTPAGDILAAVKARLGKGVIGPSLAEQIALTVAGENACDYCASAHTAIARGAGVSSEEAARNLRGEATDARVAAILEFVRTVVRERGHVPAGSLEALRDRGVGDDEIVEILAHVGVNLFTNYFNHVVGTEIDFPKVTAAQGRRARPEHTRARPHRRPRPFQPGQPWLSIGSLSCLTYRIVTKLRIASTSAIS